MEMPSISELIIIFFMILIIFGPTYYFSKRKNLSLGWNIFWTVLFGPLWWIVLLIRKKKEL